MGGQNGKQIQGQSIRINHPKFINVKVYEEKNVSYMTTMTGIEERQYIKWKSELSGFKGNSQYLLLPHEHSFGMQGFCSTAGTLKITYGYYPYLLKEEILNRKQRKSRFQQCELWFLLFSLLAAQNQMKNEFQSKIGDVRPQNIFISPEGEIRISCLKSWPREMSNFQKAFEHQETLLSPEDMNKLELGGNDDLQSYQSELFSIGMTVLSAGLLTNFQSVYDTKKVLFNYEEAEKYLKEWRKNKIYSQIFTAVICNLCSFQPQKRLSQKQLWTWLIKYQRYIIDKDDFVITYAPLKIQRQIEVLRGSKGIRESNKKKDKEFIKKPIPQQNITIPPPLQQQKLYNIMPHPQQSFQRVVSPVYMSNVLIDFRSRVSSSPPSFIQQQKILSTGPAQSKINQTDSMYAQLPSDYYLRQVISVPPQVFIQTVATSNQYVSEGNQIQMKPKQSIQPQPIDNQSGNFVYTKRIVNPVSYSVLAQENIDQSEYHKGVEQKFQAIKQSRQSFE